MDGVGVDIAGPVLQTVVITDTSPGYLDPTECCQACLDMPAQIVTHNEATAPKRQLSAFDGWYGLEGSCLIIVTVAGPCVADKHRAQEACLARGTDLCEGVYWDKSAASGQAYCPAASCCATESCPESESVNCDSPPDWRTKCNETANGVTFFRPAGTQAEPTPPPPPTPPRRPPSPPPKVCDNTCVTASDGTCDDGFDPLFSTCELGELPDTRTRVLSL